MTGRSAIDGGFQMGLDWWLSRNSPGLPHSGRPTDLADSASEFARHGLVHAGAIVFPFPSAENRDFTRANRALDEAVRVGREVGAPPMLPAYATVPCDASSVDSLAERLSNAAPCAGIKIWPYMSHVSLTALREDTHLVDLLAAHDLRVLMHVGNGREWQTRPVFPRVAADPAAAVEVARALPHLTFVAAHMLRLSRSALEQAAQLPNLWIETSGLTSLGRWQEGGREVLPADDAVPFEPPETASSVLTRVVREFGLQRRTIFGSTWPFIAWWGATPWSEARIVLDADLSEDEKDAILAGNAARLFPTLAAGAESGRR